MTERNRYISPEGLSVRAEGLAVLLHTNRFIVFEDRKLALHEKYPDCPLSPVYFDLRRLSLFPRLLREAAAMYANIARRAQPFDACVGIPDAATPLATAFALETGTPQIVIRKQAKTGHGLEGIFLTPVDPQNYSRLLVLDDLATTGGSKIEAINLLRSKGFSVSDVVVLLERGESAAAELAQHGVRLHSAFTLDQLLHYYLRTSVLDHGQLTRIHTCLAKIEEYLKTHKQVNH